MYVSGAIRDSITGNDLSGITISLVNTAGTILKTIQTEHDGWFSIDDDKLYPGSGNALYINVPGYDPLLFYPIQYGPDVSFVYELTPISAAGSPTKKADWGLIIGAAGLGLGVLSMVRKKKKVSGINPAMQTVLLYVGGGLLLYFGVLSPILKKLGILKSQETQALDNASTDPGSFWSPDYWKTISNATVLTVAGADDILDKIINAFGFWNDDENVIYGQFKRLTHKAQVSFLAYRFAQRYNADFLSWLRGGDEWYADNLSDQEVATINDYLKQLPN